MSFLDALDHGTFVFFQHHRLATQDNPWIQQLLNYLTYLGSDLAFALAGALALTLAITVKRPRVAIWILVAFVGAGLITEGAKRFVAAPRPPDAVEADGQPIRSGSFPSGHALKSAIAYPILALLAVSIYRLGRSRYLLYAAAAGIALLVGFTRIYLGVHYVTDVFGGWAFGVGWMMLCWKAMEAALQSETNGLTTVTPS